MLKKRIIPILLLKNGRLVKSIDFSNFRDVGDPISAASVYNSQYADELVVLNIDKSPVRSLSNLLNNLSKVCFMPISIGGGIRSFDDASYLIRNGADKVVVNTLCYENPGDVKKISQHFGSQAIICCIDVRVSGDDYIVYSNSGTRKEGKSLKEIINNVINLGVGELLIQSIDNDGNMSGYDLNLIKYVSSVVKGLPILALGGCGNYNDIKNLFLDTSADAAVCGSIFNFSDSNPLRIKSFLSNYNIPLKKV